MATRYMATASASETSYRGEPALDVLILALYTDQRLRTRSTVLFRQQARTLAQYAKIMTSSEASNLSTVNM